MFRFLIETFLLGLKNLRLHKLRSLLTALGIIFGVAAVIAMLAIGNGAQQEILEQMRLLGSNNVLIRPYEEQTEGNAEEEQDAKRHRALAAVHEAVLEKPPTTKNTGMIWNTQVNHCAAGATSSTLLATSRPSRNSTPAISQWPSITMARENTRRKST